jgi:hypothetical protein
MDPYLEKLREVLVSATSGMSSEEWNWHPAGKWSPAEILEHLYLTYTGTTRQLEKIMEAGWPQARQPSMLQRVRKWVVLGFNYLPEGRKAPPTTLPKGLPPENVRTQWAEKIALMDVAMARCEARFGRRARLSDHPVLGPLTVAQWRKFHLVHGRHHAKQIVRLVRAGARSI